MSKCEHDQTHIFLKPVQSISISNAILRSDTDRMLPVKADVIKLFIEPSYNNINKYWPNV